MRLVQGCFPACAPGTAAAETGLGRWRLSGAVASDNECVCLSRSFKKGWLQTWRSSVCHETAACQQMAGMGEAQVETTTPSRTAGFSSGVALRRGPRRRSASGCGGGPVPARVNSAPALSRTAEGARGEAAQATV